MHAMGFDLKYLKVSVLLILIAGVFFALGMYSTIKRNAAFSAVVSVVRSAKSNLPGLDIEKNAIIQLDFSDLSLLDTVLLPFDQKAVHLSTENGRQQQIVAVVKSSDVTALAVSQEGLLFTLAPSDCTDTDCMQPAGRIVRADGAVLDDIYDVLVVNSKGGNEYYVSYGEENTSGETKTLRLSRVRIEDVPDPQGVYSVEDVIFESTPFTLENGHAPVSAGGGLAYIADSHRVILTIGDFGLNGFANRFESDRPPAQDPESDLGKIHEIDLLTGENRVLSIGHRNPQGLVVTSLGEIISTEHGPKGGDEVNLIVSGENYGWPMTTFGTLYEQYTFPHVPLIEGTPHKGYRPPLAAFLPSIGISALTEVQNLHDAWNGDLLVGSLKTQSLYRIRRWENGHYVEQIHVGDRIRDLEIVDGKLLIASDAGKLIILKPLEDLEALRTETGLVTNKNALSKCGQCHNLSTPRSTDYAPHLVNIVSSPIASQSDFKNYSASLKGLSNQVWTEANLSAFLADPQSFAPGTSMPNSNLSTSELNEILELLRLVR